MTELELAVSYAEAGVKVFPCRAADEVTDDYDPETGEIIVLKAKSPLISGGFKGATTNIPLVKRMWPRFPGAMVGIPTGEQLGAWVLDVDRGWARVRVPGVGEGWVQRDAIGMVRASR